MAGWAMSTQGRDHVYNLFGHVLTTVGSPAAVEWSPCAWPGMTGGFEPVASSRWWTRSRRWSRLDRSDHLLDERRNLRCWRRHRGSCRSVSAWIPVPPRRVTLERLRRPDGDEGHGRRGRSTRSAPMTLWVLTLCPIHGVRCSVATLVPFFVDRSRPFRSGCFCHRCERPVDVSRWRDHMTAMLRATCRCDPRRAPGFGDRTVIVWGSAGMAISLLPCDNRRTGAGVVLPSPGRALRRSCLCCGRNARHAAVQDHGSPALVRYPGGAACPPALRHRLSGQPVR